MDAALPEGHAMLQLLNQIPLFGDYVTKPLLGTLRFIVDGVQFVVGI